MFNEEYTVEQMALETLFSGWRFCRVRRGAAPPALRCAGGVDGARRPHPPEPGNQGPARPRRRGALPPADHSAVGAERRPGAGQRAVCRMAAGREVHALRRARRTYAGAPDRLRESQQQRLRGHQPVGLSGQGRRPPLRHRHAGQRHPAGDRRGQDAGAPGGDLGGRGQRHPQRLRTERAADVCAQRPLLCHRGQVLSLRLGAHAHRYLGTVARRRNKAEGTLADVQRSIRSMLRPHVVLDILQNFTLFATDKKHRRIKIICRYQQYEGRQPDGGPRGQGLSQKGPDLALPGLGQVAADGIRGAEAADASQARQPHGDDRGGPHRPGHPDHRHLQRRRYPEHDRSRHRQELQSLLAADTRKIIITTIHKFGEADGRLNERSNIIVMVDEAHRTQEGDLGRKMRDALPNAFLFGLTGTPINKRDRNTFWAFGADEDEQGYMSRYSFQESIRDKATLPLHFEAVDVKLHINKDAIDEAYSQMTDELSELDRDDLAKRAAKMAVLIKAPERVNAICQHIVKHFQEKVEPNGFKAQVVTFDRECCVLYKKVMDELVGPEASAIVMHTQGGKSDEYAEWKLAKDEEEKLLDRFRDPNDPLKFLIVTSKLLTGFDAPILQVMYLDKPMKDHNLLQAICRTNRVYPGKTHGLIVDYLGIFDDVATASRFR
jgi:hypothetical protein